MYNTRKDDQAKGMAAVPDKYFYRWFYENFDIGAVTGVYKSLSLERYKQQQENGGPPRKKTLRRANTQNMTLRLDDHQMKVFKEVKGWRAGLSDQPNIPDHIIRRMILEEPTRDEVSKWPIENTAVLDLYTDMMGIIRGASEQEPQVERKDSLKKTAPPTARSKKSESRKKVPVDSDDE